MIATIRRVWPGDTRVTVIATDHETGRESACFVWMPEQAWIAALCERAEANGTGGKRPIVLTLEPKTRWGYHIVGAELMDIGIAAEAS